MPETRVIIVEARPVRRQRLVALIAADKHARLVASCATLMEAYTQIEAEVPDIVLISQRMTEAPEHSMLARLIELLDIDFRSYVDDLAEEQIWVNRAGQSPNAVKASELHTSRADPPGPFAPLASRLDAANKPSRTDAQAGQAVPSAGARRGFLAAPAVPRAATAGLGERSRGHFSPATTERGARLAPVRTGSQDVFILIGASTGGVEALHQVLPSFPADCPPVVVVQHIRGSFSASFAERLDRICSAHVLQAKAGITLTSGQILIAPGDSAHLVLAGRHPVQAQLLSGPSVSGHRPSVDALFDSAQPMADRVIAALLTGMGSDGARGLLALKTAGAHTIAQDRETSTVYGMPRVAAELGAASRILPLPQIAQALLSAARDRAGARSAAAANPR